MQLGPPPRSTLAALHAIGDVERLEQLTERIVEVHTWDELLHERNPRRRNGKRGSAKQK